MKDAPTSTAKPSGNWKASILICVALAAITFAVFYPVTHHAFVSFDDPEYVSDNLRVHGFSSRNIVWAFTTSHSSNWHPLTWLSHMLDWQIFGNNPGGHHLTNLIFHVLNTALVFFLLKRMTGATWRSAMVAGLFALHPLHVESVAWVSERKDLLSTFFGLISILFYAAYAQGSNSDKSRAGVRSSRFKINYCLALLFFALSLMSKPMLVTLPFVLLLLDFWPLGRLSVSNLKLQTSNIAKLFAEKLPFFALTITSCVITIWSQKRGGAISSLQELSLWYRVSNAILSYRDYLIKMFWPVDLAVFYPHHLSVSGVKVSVTLLVLVGLSWVILRYRRLLPYLLVGWLFYLGTLVPVIGLIQVGGQAMADRYTYVPLLGIFVAIVWGAAALFQKFRFQQFVSVVVAAAILASCAVRTRAQVGCWKNNQTLFQRAYEVTPRNHLAAYHVGAEFLLRDRVSEAEEMFRKSLEWNPMYPDAHRGLGHALVTQGKYEEAIPHLQRTLTSPHTRLHGLTSMGVLEVKRQNFAEAERYFRSALEMNPENPHTLNNLGIALQKQGKFEEAVATFRRAIALEPERTDGNANLVLCYIEQNKTNEADAVFQEALRHEPKNVELRGRYAAFLDTHGRSKEAIEQYRDLLKADPNSVEVLNNFAWLLTTGTDPDIRNGPEAVRLATRACELSDFKMAVVIGTLAAAYAEAGKFDEAIKTAEQARDLALKENDKAGAEMNEKLIALYREGKTARDLK